MRDHVGVQLRAPCAAPRGRRARCRRPGTRARRRRCSVISRRMKALSSTTSTVRGAVAASTVAPALPAAPSRRNPSPAFVASGRASGRASAGLRAHGRPSPCCARAAVRSHVEVDAAPVLTADVLGEDRYSGRVQRLARRDDVALAHVHSRPRRAGCGTCSPRPPAAPPARPPRAQARHVAEEHGHRRGRELGRVARIARHRRLREQHVREPADARRRVVQHDRHAGAEPERDQPSSGPATAMSATRTRELAGRPRSRRRPARRRGATPTARRQGRCRARSQAPEDALARYRRGGSRDASRRAASPPCPAPGSRPAAACRRRSRRDAPGSAVEVDHDVAAEDQMARRRSAVARRSGRAARSGRRARTSGATVTGGPAENQRSRSSAGVSASDALGIRQPRRAAARLPRSMSVPTTVSRSSRRRRGLLRRAR